MVNSDSDRGTERFTFTNHVQEQTSGSSEPLSQLDLNCSSSQNENNEDEFDLNKQFAWNEDKNEDDVVYNFAMEQFERNENGDEVDIEMIIGSIK